MRPVNFAVLPKVWCNHGRAKMGSEDLCVRACSTVRREKVCVSGFRMWDVRIKFLSTEKRTDSIVRSNRNVGRDREDAS